MSSSTQCRRLPRPDRFGYRFSAGVAYSERVTWVRAHPGWTIVIVLAIFVVVYVLFNVGGGTEDSFEISS